MVYGLFGPEKHDFAFFAAFFLTTQKRAPGRYIPISLWADGTPKRLKGENGWSDRSLFVLAAASSSL